MSDYNELLRCLDYAFGAGQKLAGNAAAAIRRQCDLLAREKDMYEASMRNVTALGRQLAAERKAREDADGIAQACERRTEAVKRSVAEEQSQKQYLRDRLAELEKREIGRAGKLALLQDRLTTVEKELEECKKK